MIDLIIFVLQPNIPKLPALINIHMNSNDQKNNNSSSILKINGNNLTIDLLHCFIDTILFRDISNMLFSSVIKLNCFILFLVIICFIYLGW